MFGKHKKKPSLLYAKIIRQSEPPKLVKWLKKNRVASSDAGANMILLFLIVGALATSAYFYSMATDTPEARAYVPIENIEIYR